MVKRIISVALVILLLSGCLCAAEAGSRSVTLNTTSKRLTITSQTANPTYQLTATTNPKDAEVIWSSSNKTVARVSSKGKVTAYSVGYTIITCSLKDKPSINATCRINVVEKEPTSIAFAAKPDVLYITTEVAEPEYRLKIAPTPSDAIVPDAVWKSDSPDIVTVNQKGKVTGLKAGTATVTATLSNGLKASCKIKVAEKPATKLKLSQTERTLVISTDRPGPTFKLTYTYEPGDAIFSGVKWSSSDTNVATVDDTGKVKAVMPGTCRIICKARGVSVTAECKVTVKNQEVTRIDLSETSKTLTLSPVEDNPTFTLTAKVYPDNAMDTSVKWKSSNPSVATVNSKGKVTAWAAGTAIITCEAKDGGGTKATCKVTVKKQQARLEYRNVRVYRFYGELALDVQFVNNTYDTIDRIDFRVTYYDSYGRKVKGYGYYDYDDNWYDASILKPGDVSRADWYWDARGYDGAVSARIQLLSYHTTSGRTVRLY